VSQSKIRQVDLGPIAAPTVWDNRPIRYLICCGVLIVVGIVVCIAVMVDNFRDRVLADNSRELKNTALILAEQIDRSFQSIALVQNRVVAKVQSLGITSSEDFARRMSGPDIGIMLKTSISGLAQLDFISILDADAKLINYSYDWPIPALSSADRDYFKALKSDAKLMSFIGRPVRSRINGMWILYLAHKLTTTNGEFLGVVLGAVELSYFEKIFGSIVLGNDSAITLFRNDGVVLARFPRVESVIGETLTASINALGSGDSGTARIIGRMDGKDRLLAAHKLAHYPLLISVAANTSAVLAGWKDETKVLLSVGGFAALATAVMILLIVRQLSLRQKSVEEDLRRSKLFLDTVIESVPLPIMVKSVDAGRYTLLNRAAEQLFGFNRDRIIGRTAHDVFDNERGNIIEALDREILLSAKSLVVRNHSVPTPHGDRSISTTRVVIRGGDGKPEYLLTLIDDLTERKEAEQRIAHMALHDALTGLSNRTQLVEYLQGALAVIASQGGSLAVHFINLDRFKNVNDAFGHDGGDFLLKTVADRLRSVTRVGDAVARLGGDEFVVIQTRVSSKDQIDKFARRLASAVSAPMRIKEHDVVAMVSIGVAVALADGTDPEWLLKNADLALYKAKTDGRNCIRFFAPEMDIEMLERIELERTIRNALLHDQFELHYQPIFQISDRRLIGFEALIRLPKGDGTLIPPPLFIPVAEEMLLIEKIGAWVLWEACCAAATWPEFLTVAVNLSPAQFAAGSVSDIVAVALRETGLAARRLELEITETLLLGNSKAIMSELQTIKSMGAAIVMDDFGTGYSSLSYLWRFPFDKIKIDRSFMQGLDGSGRDSGTVVKTIIALGRELNMRVTVEGVETAMQAAFLDKVNGDQAQGFYFGRPVPLSEVAGIILSDFHKSQAPTPSETATKDKQRRIKSSAGR
jgi:diguanylate cyclase (GGDEF)-like protein/PAS domain S-box-containing protein